MRTVSGLAAAAAVIATLSTSTQAAIIVYTTSMNGPSESPPVPSPGTGSATLTFDTLLNTMRVEASFNDLVGTSTVAHVHCCTAVAGAGTAGVAATPGTFLGWPSGLTSGSYDRTFDMTQTTSYTAAFLNANGGTALGALSGLLAGIDAGKAYFNVHSTFRPGGEIRGFLQVPEPAGAALVLAGLAALALVTRRRG